MILIAMISQTMTGPFRFHLSVRGGVVILTAETFLMELLSWTPDQEIESWDEEKDVWVRREASGFLVFRAGERMTILRRLGVGGSGGGFAREMRRMARLNAGRWKDQKSPSATAS